jgi:hypothetical protein
MAMDRALSWQIAREKIPAYAVVVIAGRIVIRVTRERDDVTVERMRDLANEMAGEIHRNFVARNGYDYLPAMRAAIEPVAGKHGLVAYASRSLAVTFRNRRSHFAIDTRLINAATPVLEIDAIDGRHCEAIARLPVPNAAELARVLAHAATTIDAWFAGRMSR